MTIAYHKQSAYGTELREKITAMRKRHATKLKAAFLTTENDTWLSMGDGRHIKITRRPA